MKRALPATVLVTGASGFLGAHVSAALLQRGVTVRALVRRRDAAVAAQGTAAVVSGLDDVDGLRRAMEGVEGVIHLAARVHQTNGPADAAASLAVNRDGTATLVEAAVEAGVRDFVFLSTVKAVGDTSANRWTEETPPNPTDPYGVAKLEAERLVAERAASNGLHAPILRLPLVYGPGMKANALRLFDAVERGLPLPFGGVRNRRSLLYTGNLTAAILATLESPAGSDLFFVSDDDDVSTPELVAAIGGALERPARLLPMPMGLLRVVARAGDVLARMGPFPLTTAALNRLLGSLAVDCTHLRQATGYAPPYRLREGLRLTAEWYRGRPRAGA